MLTGALLGLMRQLGLDIITLTEGISEAEFFSSTLTRKEVLRLLRSMAQTASDVPQKIRANLPLIDWDAWAALPSRLEQPAVYPLQVWVAIQELAPMTVHHLNGYRRTQPKLFSIVP